MIPRNNHIHKTPQPRLQNWKGEKAIDNHMKQQTDQSDTKYANQNQQKIHKNASKLVSDPGIRTNQLKFCHQVIFFTFLTAKLTHIFSASKTSSQLSANVFKHFYVRALLNVANCKSVCNCMRDNKWQIISVSYHNWFVYSQMPNA